MDIAGRLSYRWPRPLRQGDRVALVAPSSPVEASQLERGSALLASWGLDVTVGAHIHEVDRYLAGSDRDRAADLIAAWTDPTVTAVICARGGYGATRLLPLLDPAGLAIGRDKVFVGGSDVTVLHAAIGSRLDLVTFFAPMPAASVLGGQEPDAHTLRSLRAALFGEAVAPLTGTTLVGGKAEGRLTGGTLALLAALAGTPHATNARGCIAFLEDVGEKPFQIDRLLTQLLHSGWFDAVSGIALGQWPDCGDDVLGTILERLEPLRVPIVAGLHVGHGPIQLTLPLGSGATLYADADARLEIQSP